MKKYGKILLLFLTILLYSCQNSEDPSEDCKYGSDILEIRQREIPKFDKIKVNNFSYIYYTQADSTSLIIETDDNLHGYINTDVLNKKLIISNEGNICPSQVTIYITSPDIKEIEMAGSGSFTSKKRIDTDTLSVVISGTISNIIINSLITEYFEAIIETAGTIRADGISGDIYANIKGSKGNNNKIDLKNLYADTGSVFIEGKGEITVNVADKLEAIITGIGNILYVGDPVEKDFKVLGEGSIERLD